MTFDELRRVSRKEFEMAGCTCEKYGYATFNEYVAYMRVFRETIEEQLSELYEDDEFVLTDEQWKAIAQEIEDGMEITYFKYVIKDVLEYAKHILKESDHEKV
jgi:hypothetical protein